MVSGSTIRSALAAVGAVGKQIRSFDELAAGANDALRQAPPGLTAAGAASFLATCAQESAYFRTTREFGSGQWYAPWIGRGFVQCTHESNYRAFGAWAHRKGLASDPNLFVKHRAALEDYRYAWATASWYFEANNLWPWANAGDHRRTQQAVNGGRGRAGTSFVPNHWKERNAMFQAFLRAGNALLPPGGPASGSPAEAPEKATPPRRRSRRESRVLYFKSPEPAPGTPKKDWPTILVPYRFDPIGGWGGKCILTVDWFGRGGWLKSGQWWVRDPNWTANRPLHFPTEHPVGTGGSERFVGYGWETAPPVRADSIQITTSCPDGLIVDVVYEK